jgi:ubiquinol-cytochrome c reductase iron-sulfur subunit
MTGGHDDDKPEVAILASFAIAVLGAAGFAATYVLGGQTQILGAALAVSFGGLAVGLTVWARHLQPSGGFVEEHEGFSSTKTDNAALVERLTEISRPRRRGLLGMLAFAVAALGVAALFPLRSLLQPKGAHPTRQLAQTPWRLGNLRLVDGTGQPIRVDQVNSETIVRAFPEGHTEAGDVPTFVVRIKPDRFTAPPPAGDIDGVVAYSLLCTHAGCPVSLYEQGTGRMLCPCHQSIFDLLAGGRPIAGPAARSLPGLPIATDKDGFLYATGDFTGPPGPGYWSRP